MDQSNILDLRAWVDEIAAHFGWETGTTEDGDWSITTAQGVKILVEPQPEIESRTLVFTALVAKVSDAINRDLLLNLLLLNSAIDYQGAPAVAYAPAAESIILRQVFSGNKDTWNGANFAESLSTFSSAADQLAGVIVDGSITPPSEEPSGTATSHFTAPTYA